MTLQNAFSTLGFIGAGNMAGAILRGTVGRGLLDGHRVYACDVSKEKVEEIAAELGIQTAGSARELTQQAEAILLAVKPQALAELLTEIASLITPRHLIISIAAGVSLETMAALLPSGTRIVRVMPNTPALVGAGAAGVAPGAHATAADLEATLALFRAVGQAEEVPESLMHAVTALSGSGPAYVFRCMEIIIATGIEMGLTPEISRALTLQTFLGSAMLASQSAEDPEELRKRVTSPNGTTAAALEAFESQGLPKVLRAGVLSARDRSIALSQGK